MRSCHRDAQRSTSHFSGGRRVGAPVENSALDVERILESLRAVVKVTIPGLRVSRVLTWAWARAP